MNGKFRELSAQTNLSWKNADIDYIEYHPKYMHFITSKHFMKLVNSRKPKMVSDKMAILGEKKFESVTI